MQPIVRVMRLYKPGLHTSLNDGGAPKFSLSPFLMLPDSFGDIYSGETFSAYISVVNDHFRIPFENVKLQVRLHTNSAAHDLIDARSEPGHDPSKSRALA